MRVADHLLESVPNYQRLENAPTLYEVKSLRSTKQFQLEEEIRQKEHSLKLAQ